MFAGVDIARSICIALTSLAVVLAAYRTAKSRLGGTDVPDHLRTAAPLTPAPVPGGESHVRELSASLSTAKFLKEGLWRGDPGLKSQICTYAQDECDGDDWESASHEVAATKKRLENSRQAVEDAQDGPRDAGKLVADCVDKYWWPVDALCDDYYEDERELAERDLRDAQAEYESAYRAEAAAGTHQASCAMAEFCAVVQSNDWLESRWNSAF